MSDKKVFDFTAKRQQTIEQKRRQFERVMFEEFLGVYSVVDDEGSGFPIKLVDISREGCLFQMPFTPQVKQRFKSGSDHTIKLYFTKGTYLSVVVKVRHATEFVDKRGDAQWRCGGEFDTSLPGFKALASFIEFIYQYAENSSQDKGEQKVFFL